MAITSTTAPRILGVVTSVPPQRVDNLTADTGFDREEVDKIVRLAGVKARYQASDDICSSDLCVAAARRLLTRLEWPPDSVDALIFITQTPDYLLPSTCCVAHAQLGLSDACAALDVGLGCSGYPYGLWLAAAMLQRPGIRRLLLLHGETPTRFAHPADRSVALLFGDAGSATALVPGNSPSSHPDWWFALHSDGSGRDDLILPGGGFRSRFPTDPRAHYVAMNGPNIFNFTIKRVPGLIEETLRAAGITGEEVDYFVLHQSNQFILRHLAKKAQLPDAKFPMVIGEFGSAGGPSIALTMTRGGFTRPADRALRLLLVGYGVGLSWASALVDLPPTAVLDHLVMEQPQSL